MGARQDEAAASVRAWLNGGPGRECVASRNTFVLHCSAITLLDRGGAPCTAAAAQ